MENGIYAKFNTAKGNILVKLEHELTPGTVGNFVALAEGNMENKVKPQGQKFYDGLNFHRVIPDFMIQGGCPQGTGTGDPGYKFDDDFHPSLKQIKQQVNQNTKLIILSHLFGSPISEIEEIANFCNENNIYLIEDNAQSFGSEINKKHTGSFGVISTTSFFPESVSATFRGYKRVSLSGVVIVTEPSSYIVLIIGLVVFGGVSGDVGFLVENSKA